MNERSEIRGDQVNFNNVGSGFNGETGNENSEAGCENAEGGESGYQTEYYDSDEIVDIVSDEKEMVDDATRMKSKYSSCNESAAIPIIECRMFFENFEQFKCVVSLYSIRSKRAVRWVKNCQTKIRGKCVDDNCPWVIYAAYVKGLNSLQVRTFKDEHDCNRVFTNPLMSTKIMAELFVDDLKKNPFMKTADIRASVKDKFGIDVSISMVRRAKKDVRDKVVFNY